MKKEIKTLKNYSLATIEQPGADIAKAVISIDVHTENNPSNQAALIMFSDALLSGAGKFSRDEFLHEVNKLGASIEVTTSQGNITFTLRSTEKTFSKLLQLFEIMVTKPTFSTGELKRIKTTTKNGLHQSREDSKAAAADNLRNLFYGNNDRHYSYTIDELINAVDQIGAKELKQIHKTLLSRNWVVSVAGNKQTISKCTDVVEKVRRTAPKTTSVSTTQLRAHKPKLELENIPSRQNIDFSIGVPVPLDVRDDDYVPLNFGIAVLAKWGGFAGRLMSTVREKEGLTYGIYGKLEGQSNGEQGYFRIMTFFAPEKSKLALTSTFREIKNIYTKGITDAEFRKFKTILATQQALLNDSLSRQLSDLHAYHQAGFTVAEMEEHKAKIETVTKKQINDSIRKYLNPKTMSVSGAGPTAAVKKELEEWYKTVS